jgi:hypothetical protein
MTPIDLGCKKKGTVIAPVDGWETNTYYEVKVAFSSINTIHKAVFYSGFVRKGKPCGYNCLLHPIYDNKPSIGSTYYLKVIRKLDLDLKV